ncbi:MAG TPA: hypothetical protein VJ952_03945 [Opitutales bacterium]|nr:hypothetical protein [Opitutales bacterium]
MALTVLGCLSLTIGSAPLQAELSEGETDPGAEQARQAPNRNPMDTEGLEPKLSRVLENYYRKTFSSPENWEELESVMFVGILQTAQGRFHFTAYKKKPNLAKVIIRNPHGRGRLVFGYDGGEAWQSNSIASDNPRPMLMPPGEAKNFIRDAPIGGHLLDPLKEGKELKISGIVEVDGKNCYEIETTLPDGQRIRSAIDIVEYAERRQITTNQVNAKDESNIYRDFRVIEGVRFPFTSVMRSNGEEVHRVEMLKIRVNPGLTKSIFQRSSEVVSPQSETESATDKESRLEQAGVPPSPNPFGEVPFGASSFPDPGEIEGVRIFEEAETR